MQNRKNRLGANPSSALLEPKVMLDASSPESEQASGQPTVSAEPSVSETFAIDESLSADSPQETSSNSANLLAPAQQAVDEVISGDVVAAEDIDFSTLSGTELGRLAAEGADVIGRAASDPVDVQETDRGQSLVAGVREQLVLDGATVTEIEEFDQAVRTISTQRVLGVAGSPDFDQQVFSNTRNSIQSATLPAFEGATSRTRDPLLENAIDGAIANNGERQVTEGRLQLGTYIDFFEVLVTTADDLSRGVAEGNDNAIRDAQDEFGSIRAELVRRGGTTAGELAELNTSFASLVRFNADQLIGGPQEGLAVLFRSVLQDALRATALSNNEFEDGFRIRSTRSFDGTNGKEKITIYARDQFPGEPFFEDGEIPIFISNVLEHQVYIEDIIERQLQEAGQGYDLVNLELQPDGVVENGSLMAIAEAAPDFATNSVIVSIRPEVFEDGIRSLAQANNEILGDVDLSESITVDNFEKYSDVIRTIALNVDQLQDDLPEDDLNRWRQLDREIRGLEAVAAAGTKLFTAVPNNNQRIPGSAFIQVDGLPGTVTRVGAIGGSRRDENVFERNDFVTFEDGATVEELIDRRLIRDQESSGDTRGPFIDVFAPGGLPVDPFNPEGQPFGLERSINTGNSFGTPEMAVNAILGLFDPTTQRRIPQS